MGRDGSAIQYIQPERIRDLVRSALRADFDLAALQDDLAMVDWGSGKLADPETVSLLGRVEGWATLFAEGDVSFAEFVGRMLSLLPAPERSRRLVMGSPFTIDLTSTARPTKALPDITTARAAQPSQAVDVSLSPAVLDSPSRVA